MQNRFCVISKYTVDIIILAWGNT